MEIFEAIKAAKLAGARIPGLDDETGTLEKQEAADFVVSGKSDEDIKDIHLIDNLDKDGKLIQ